MEENNNQHRIELMLELCPAAMNLVKWDAWKQSIPEVFWGGLAKIFQNESLSKELADNAGYWRILNTPNWRNLSIQQAFLIAAGLDIDVINRDYIPNITSIPMSTLDLTYEINLESLKEKASMWKHPGYRLFLDKCFDMKMWAMDKKAPISLKKENCSFEQKVDAATGPGWDWFNLYEKRKFIQIFETILPRTKRLGDFWCGFYHDRTVEIRPFIISYLWPEIPKQWTRYISSPIVAEWAIAYKHYLSQCRMVTDFGDQVIRSENYLILKNLGDTHTPGYYKITSPEENWDEVYKAWICHQIQEKEKFTLMADDRPFIKCPSRIINVIKKNTRWCKIAICKNDLVEIGKSMHCCIDNPVTFEQCWSGRSCIAHIGGEAPKGAIVEFHTSTKNFLICDEWKVGQVYGYNGSSPDNEIYNLAQRIVDKINM